MGQLWLLAAGLGGTLAVLLFVARLGWPSGEAPSPEALAARVANEAPDLLTGGPILCGADGALVALERTGRRLALLLPHGAHHVFWVVPAKRARVEWAKPPVLAVATGDMSRPWVRAPLPEGHSGTVFLRLLGGEA